MRYFPKPNEDHIKWFDAEVLRLVEDRVCRPNPLLPLLTQRTPTQQAADRLGFEPFSYTERS